MEKLLDEAVMTLDYVFFIVIMSIISVSILKLLANKIKNRK